VDTYFNLMLVKSKIKAHQYDELSSTDYEVPEIIPGQKEKYRFWPKFIKDELETHETTRNFGMPFFYLLTFQLWRKNVKVSHRMRVELVTYLILFLATVIAGASLFYVKPASTSPHNFFF